MKSITYLEAKNNPALILEINESFHDIEAKIYENNHPEIYSYEKDSWKKIFSKMKALTVDNGHITVLDIGTGVGFVPLAIADLLTNEDTVIFSDISGAMLEQARKNTESYVFNKKFVLTKNSYDEFLDSSVDIVTLNSVLHHIADVTNLFKEVVRILKPGGVLIIKHEPNIRFSRNLVLSNIYKILQLIRKRNSNRSAPLNVIHLKTIKLLESRGIVFMPELTGPELQSLVDIHSPTATGFLDGSRGFDPYVLAPLLSSRAELIECNTYGYFGKIRDDATNVRKCFSRLLRSVFPRDGYFFDVVIKKM
ncbi:MAG: hypothetical protein RLZZ480_329 [Candidatus Parcubacteria bacterium]|jgi:ubiquinone/menaquinone biosynthesis C-methylase UbiE